MDRTKGAAKAPRQITLDKAFGDKTRTIFFWCRGRAVSELVI